MTRSRQRLISLLVLAAMVVLWQVISSIYTAEVFPGVPMMPGWDKLFTTTLVSMADYFQGGFGIASVADGAQRSYPAALLAIVQHSFDTLVRLYVGLFIGAVVGTLIGLAISWSPWTRRLVDLPVQLLRTLPLLAMVPLFQLWFGTHFSGKVIFVAYGVGVLFVAGTINAIKNVPQIYLDNARTLGAGKLTLYRTIILPAIFPELRATILLSLGTAWAAVVGAEYLGSQSGLGYILVYAQQFGYVDRMFFIGLLFIVFATISYAIFNSISARMLQWAPRTAAQARLA